MQFLVVPSGDLLVTLSLSRWSPSDFEPTTALNFPITRLYLFWNGVFEALELAEKFLWALLNAWDSPKDKASWKNVINSEECSPDVACNPSLHDSYSYYVSLFSYMNNKLLTFFPQKIRPFLPYSIRESEIWPVSLDDIRSALKNVKRSPTMDSDGICFHYFSYDCIAIIFRLQILFQSSLAEWIVPNSFLLGFFPLSRSEEKTLKILVIIDQILFYIFLVIYLSIY